VGEGVRQRSSGRLCARALWPVQMFRVGRPFIRTRPPPCVTRKRGDCHARSRPSAERAAYSLETILGKRGISIAARAIDFSLRAAARSSHFERFARCDGGWSAQSSRLWASIRANFLIQPRSPRIPRSPAVPAIESSRYRKIVSIEGLNNKIRLITRRAFGFHSAKALTAMIHLCCGGIPLTPPLPVLA
jgi:hypothetical protein